MQGKKEKSIGGSYIKVSAFGAYAETFMDEITKRGTRVWDIENKDGMLYFKCRPTHYLKTARTAAKYGVRTKVAERRGFYFKHRKYKKRFGFFFGLLGFSLIIVIMTNFIWEIEVSGNELLSSAQIKEQLLKNGIHSGVHTDSFNAPEAELNLKLALDKLAWVSIERSGSKLLVKVSENKSTGASEKISTSEPCNIVAAKSGRVYETEVYRGKLLLPKGSGVAAGDVIVSGIIPDGAGGQILTHADAKIIAECVETLEFFQPYTVTEKKKTGKTARRDYVSMLGNDFPLFLTNPNTKNAEYREEVRAPEIFGLRLPFRIKSSYYSYYKYMDVTYSPEESLKKLEEQITTYIDNFLSGDEIVSRKTDTFSGENGVSAKVEIIYRTNIAEKRAILN